MIGAAVAILTLVIFNVGVITYWAIRFDRLSRKVDTMDRQLDAVNRVVASLPSTT